MSHVYNCKMSQTDKSRNHYNNGNNKKNNNNNNNNNNNEQFWYCLIEPTLKSLIIILATESWQLFRCELVDGRNSWIDFNAF